MNLPTKVKTDKNFVDGDGSPRTDIAIYKHYLICHPNRLDFVIHMFKNNMGIVLEVID